MRGALLLEGSLRPRLLLLRYLLSFDGYLLRFLGRLSWCSRGCLPPWRGWGWYTPRRSGSAWSACCGRLPVPPCALYVPHPRGTAHSGALRVSIPSGPQEGLVPSLLGWVQGYWGHPLALAGLVFGPPSALEGGGALPPSFPPLPFPAPLPEPFPLPFPPPLPPPLGWPRPLPLSPGPCRPLALGEPVQATGRGTCGRGCTATAYGSNGRRVL